MSIRLLPAGPRVKSVGWKPIMDSRAGLRRRDVSLERHPAARRRQGPERQPHVVRVAVGGLRYHDRRAAEHSASACLKDVRSLGDARIHESSIRASRGSGHYGRPNLGIVSRQQHDLRVRNGSSGVVDSQARDRRSLRRADRERDIERIPAGGEVHRSGGKGGRAFRERTSSQTRPAPTARTVQARHGGSSRLGTARRLETIHDRPCCRRRRHRSRAGNATHRRRIPVARSGARRQVPDPRIRRALGPRWRSWASARGLDSRDRRP